MMNMQLQCAFQGILQKMAFEYNSTLEISARFREWVAATDKQHVWKHSNVLPVCKAESDRDTEIHLFMSLFFKLE